MSQPGWMGCLRIFWLYMAGVVLGSLAASAFSPNNYMVGASAGVYALIAAHLGKCAKIVWFKSNFSQLSLQFYSNSNSKLAWRWDCLQSSQVQSERLECSQRFESGHSGSSVNICHPVCCDWCCTNYLHSKLIHFYVLFCHLWIYSLLIMETQRSESFGEMFVSRWLCW